MNTSYRSAICLLSVVLYGLAGCSSKKTLIYPAPGAPLPGTWMIGTQESGVETSTWEAVFEHREAGVWVSDTMISMATEPVLVLDKFQGKRFFPKATEAVDTFRIQVVSHGEVMDEAVITRE